MSLCPSSSHQLVAAAIAFRRARRKFPKDFGLESAIECAPGNAKAETATSREGPINQARSSSSLVKRACGSRFDHVCPTSARDRDYERLYVGENSIGCSCCRPGRNAEDISTLRDECSGGDAIDSALPSREHEEVLPATTSAAGKSGLARAAERDRCDVTSRGTNDEEWISQSAHSSTFYHHRNARCSSRPCSSLAAGSLMCDAEETDRVACGDSLEDKGKGFGSSSCHGASIDSNDVEEDVATSDRVRGQRSNVGNAWAKLDALPPHQRIADSIWRCRCEESHSRKESTLDLLGSLCDPHCDGCRHHRRHQHRRDYIHQLCSCQRHDGSVKTRGLIDILC